MGLEGKEWEREREGGGGAVDLVNDSMSEMFVLSL